MTPTQPTKKTKHHGVKHGLTTLKKAVRVLGGRAIDRRTALGRALEDWRHSIIQDLGGVEQTSTQQRQVIDLAVRTKLILDSTDAYLVKQPSLVNHRRWSLLPVVAEGRLIMIRCVNCGQRFERVVNRHRAHRPEPYSQSCARCEPRKQTR